MKWRGEQTAVEMISASVFDKNKNVTRRGFRSIAKAESSSEMPSGRKTTKARLKPHDCKTNAFNEDKEGTTHAEYIAA
jgi:hypothetical protein